MDRRKFIIGAGSLAAGGATGLGTGAFSTMSADREASINVVNDANGLVALESNLDSDTVRQTDQGELVIDLTADGNAGGININSRYTFGADPPTNVEDAAILVTNQDTEEKDVTITFEYDDPPGFEWRNSHFRFWFGTDIAGDDAGTFVRGNEKSGSKTTSLGSGETGGMSFIVNSNPPVDVEEYSPDDIDMSGILRISAD